MRWFVMIVLLCITFFGGITYGSQDIVLGEEYIEKQKTEAEIKEEIIEEKAYYDALQYEEEGGYLLSLASFFEKMFIQVYHVLTQIVFTIADSLIT